MHFIILCKMRYISYYIIIINANDNDPDSDTDTDNN